MSMDALWSVRACGWQLMLTSLLQVFLLHYRRFGVVTDLVKSGGAPIHMFSANVYSLPHAALSNSLMTGGAGGPGMPTQLSVSMSTGCSA